jgi:hypothetical protein
MTGISPPHVARQSPSTHSMRPGVGFINHDAEPKIPAGIKAKHPVKPSKEAKNGSLHYLDSPGGSRVLMRWDGSTWASGLSPLLGNRIAYKPEFLGRAGWSYGALVM